MDRIDFPKFDLWNLPVKIDTGAYGCALHCHHAEVIDDAGKPTLRYKILDPKHADYRDSYYYTTDFTFKKVRSSVGIAEKRFAIKSDITVFGKNYKVTFTLVNRRKMRYPILIGRKFLSNKFLVNVALKDMSFKNKKTE
ncbi:MAG: hypothetical protein ACJA08_001382 [Cyclobacteriaceae bacterium]|jgi:hypothetical protein